MGRVNQALWRAATSGDDAARDAWVRTNTGDGSDVDVLANEPFLIETQAQAEAPRIQEVPRTQHRQPARILHNPSAPVLRHYRRLAATLERAQEKNGVKVIMVASAVSQEGATLTAANLALTLSESCRRSVLLIDANLQKPAIHTVFNLDATAGLSDVLLSTVAASKAFRAVSERLSVLTAGGASSDPIAGVTSFRMHGVIAEARDSFDWVILDTPPIGLLPDVNLLTAWIDASVFVVRADSTPYHIVQQAIDQLGRDRILGVVLNRATAPSRLPHDDFDSHAAHPRSQLGL